MNPIELEIHRHLLESVAEEMGVVLRRTALSANIKERLDFSCAITDADADMVAQAAHIPVHLGSCHLTAGHLLARGDLEAGDVLLVNDPYRGGTHLPDITVFRPLFVEGFDGPLFGLIARAHHADVGGGVPGSMGDFDEIYKEGLIIPPVKIVRRGELDSDILDFVLANVRTPDERRGDLLAQIGATARGAATLEGLVARYGIATMREAGEALKDRADRAVKAVLRAMPRGRFEAEDRLDGPESPLIRVAIEVRGEGLVVDFEGSDPAMAGALNAHEAITLSCVFYCLRSLAADSVPTNSGCLRPLDLRLPPGSIVGAQSPSAVAGGNVETSQRIVDVVYHALAQALPDRIPAASQGSMNNLSFGGVDAEGQAFTYFETIAGGVGASATQRGASGLHSHMTNTMNTPTEALERSLPLRVRRYGLRRGSGGVGKHAGGEGVVREIEVLQAMTATLLTTRRESQPYGLDGGEPGGLGRNSLLSKGKTRRLAACGSVDLNPGDAIRIETPGGGAFGAALPARSKKRGG